MNTLNMRNTPCVKVNAGLKPAFSEKKEKEDNVIESEALSFTVQINEVHLSICACKAAVGRQKTKNRLSVRLIADELKVGQTAATDNKDNSETNCS